MYEPEPEPPPRPAPLRVELVAVDVPFLQVLVSTWRVLAASAAISLVAGAIGGVMALLLRAAFGV